MPFICLLPRLRYWPKLIETSICRILLENFLSTIGIITKVIRQKRIAKRFENMALLLITVRVFDYWRLNLILTLDSSNRKILMALLYPEERSAHPLRLALPLALAAGLWGGGFVTLPDAARFAQFTPLAIVECVGLILVIAALPLWVVLRLSARGAPTRPALTGALAGLVVGSGAAAGYSFFCLQDNPLFYVTWYGTAIALTMIAGAWLGARRLRW